MMNRIILQGRLTRDPECRTTSNGTQVTSFCLAVERDFKDKSTNDRECDFIECVAWRSRAEFVNSYLTKGRAALVEGRLQTRTYEDNQGNKRKVFEVVVENVYFADSKTSAGNTQSVPQQKNQQSYNSYSGIGYNQTPNSHSEYSDMSDQDGDLPF